MSIKQPSASFTLRALRRVAHYIDKTLFDDVWRAFDPQGVPMPTKPKPTTLILDLFEPTVGQVYAGFASLGHTLDQAFYIGIYIGKDLNGRYIMQREGENETFCVKAVFPLSFIEAIFTCDRFQPTKAFRAHCKRLGLKVPK